MRFIERKKSIELLVKKDESIVRVEYMKDRIYLNRSKSFYYYVGNIPDENFPRKSLQIPFFFFFFKPKGNRN